MDNCNFQWPDDQPHPLLIPEVIAKIISHLGIVSLQTCRTVSKDWNLEALKALRKFEIVTETFQYRWEIDYYNRNLKTRPHSQMKFTMDQLALHISDPMITYYTRWGSHIQYLDISIRCPSYPHRLFEILTEHLPNLERLALKIYPEKVELSIHRKQREPIQFAISSEHERDNSSSGSDDSDSDYPELTDVPDDLIYEADSWPIRFQNLKEFKFKMQQFEGRPNAFPVESTLKKLLWTMPTLEKLSFVDDFRVLPNCFVEVLKVSKIDLVKYGVNNQLYLSNESLPILAGTGRSHPFKYLDVKVDKSTELTFFLLKCPNLHTLKIQFPSDISINEYFVENEQYFRSLKHLKHLTITNFKGSVEQFTPFEGLQTLIINKAEFVLRQSRVKNNEEECKHELTTFKTDSIANIWLMSSLKRSFKQLAILKLDGLDDDGLFKIYEHLHCLEEFEITNGNCTDHGLTGIDIAKIAKSYRIGESGEFVPLELEGLSNCLSENRTELYIASVSNLKTLKICSENITDISIFHGIVDCKKLEHLTLKCSQVTDEGILTVICLDGQLKSLDISGCSKVSSEMKNSILWSYNQTDI